MREIIQTKLNVPRLQNNHFTRSRLLNKIDVDQKGNLILISAPAGYGKTTLVSEWTSKNLDSCAWYSLGDEDNNVFTFVRYLVESLKKIDISLGESVLKDMELLESIGLENLFISLINEFIEYRDDITFVLDDYHLIENAEIKKGVNMLLEHIPDNTRVIIITRNQESIPTTKLRAKNRLLEINVDDLVFDFDETSIFLSEYLHQKLSDQSISFIQEKTEGWVTSLHLFALSLLRQDDPSEFIETFSGEHEYIFDYLLEEVFKLQPVSIRKFMMVTSLFGRFNASLAAAILELTEEDAKERLNEVKKSNLFIVCLDNEKSWHRYHQLFQEFLQKKFFDIGLEESLVLEIYDFASSWFEERGFIHEAIDSAILAQRYEHVASMLEKIWVEKKLKVESKTWIAWIGSLPESVLENRLILNIGYSWALLDIANYSKCKEYMNKSSVLCDRYKINDPAVIVLDKSSLKMVPPLINGARAFVSMMEQNVDDAYKYAKLAHEDPSLEQLCRKKVIRTILALSLWCLGKLDESLEVLYKYSDGLGAKVQNAFFVGRIFLGKGKLLHTKEHYKLIINQNEKTGRYVETMFASFYHELAVLEYYQGNYEEAKKHLIKSEEVSKENKVVTWDYYYQKTSALISTAEYKFDDALKKLNIAEQSLYPSPLRDFDSIDALRTNIYIKQGKTSLVFEYISKFDENVPSKISFLDENNYITLVKALLYKYRYYKNKETLDRAKKIIEVLIKSLIENKRETKLVEVKILETHVQLIIGCRGAASECLKEAIELAVVESYVNPFIDSASCLKTLLTDATLEWKHNEFVLKITKEINSSLQLQEKILHPNKMDLLVAPLSKRELEVLVLIAQGLTNEEISKTLFLALSTIKNYNQNIFNKLQVKNRIEAIKRASEIGII